MNREEIVKMMLESINSDNRQYCLDMGMSEEDTEKQIAQSQMTLGAMMENIYDKMLDKQLLVIEG